MKRKKLVILPKINNGKRDLSRQWFIYYSVRNPASDKMQRFKVYGNLSAFTTVESRTKAAENLCQEYAEKLKTGWSPLIDDSMVIYNDQLEYDKITRIYGKKRADNKTIRYYGSKYLEHIMGNIDQEGTLPTYQSKIRIFCMWADSQGLGGNDVTTINNRNMVDFFKWLIDDQERSKKTISTYRQVLQSFFEWMVKQKIFISNPVHDLPNTTRINDQAPYPIQRADIPIFKEATKNDPQLWLAIQFQYYCALRPGHELRELKIKNINFSSGLVTVTRAQAKKRITRTVVIPDNFLEEIKSFYRLQEYDKEFFVFSRNGQPGEKLLGKNNLRFRYNKIREMLGMPVEYKFYGWKYTGGVEASLAGIPDKHIQMQFGHSSLATTERYLMRMRGYQSILLKRNFPGI